MKQERIDEIYADLQNPRYLTLLEEKLSGITASYVSSTIGKILNLLEDYNNYRLEICQELDKLRLQRNLADTELGMRRYEILTSGNHDFTGMTSEIRHYQVLKIMEADRKAFCDQNGKPYKNLSLLMAELDSDIGNAEGLLKALDYTISTLKAKDSGVRLQSNSGAIEARISKGLGNQTQETPDPPKPKKSKKQEAEISDRIQYQVENVPVPEEEPEPEVKTTKLLEELLKD